MKEEFTYFPETKARPQSANGGRFRKSERPQADRKLYLR